MFFFSYMEGLCYLRKWPLLIHLLMIHLRWQLWFLGIWNTDLNTKWCFFSHTWKACAISGSGPCWSIFCPSTCWWFIYGDSCGFLAFETLIWIGHVIYCDLAFCRWRKFMSWCILAFRSFLESRRLWLLHQEMQKQLQPLLLDILFWVVLGLLVFCLISARLPCMIGG